MTTAANKLFTVFAPSGGLDPIASVAFMGDSIMSGSFGTETSAAIVVSNIEGWATAENSGLAIVTDAGSSFATGGFGIQDMIDTHLSPALASGADTLVYMAGTNDFADYWTTYGDHDAAAAALWAKHVEVQQAAKSAGMRCVVCTVTPDVSTVADIAEHRLVRKQTNDLIRAHSAANGAVVCDWAGEISTDPSDDTALADAAFLRDLVHPNYLGGWRLGAKLAETFRTQFVTPSPFEMPPAGASWASDNPLMEGDSAGKATGWNVLLSGGATATSTKSGPNSQRLEIVGSPPGDTSKYVRLTRDLTVTDDSLDLSLLRGVCRIIPTEIGWALWAIEMKLLCSNLDNGASYPTRQTYHPINLGSTEMATIGEVSLPAASGEWLMLTKPVRHAGGEAANRRLLRCELKIYGSGTLDVTAFGAIFV